MRPRYIAASHWASMRNGLSRLGLLTLWLLHFLPLRVLAALGRGFGLLLYVLGKERRFVARRNLQLCFPTLDKGAIERRVRDHFRAFGRSFLEYGIVWWGSAERMRSFVKLEGLEHWQAVSDRPVIWLAPHFVGLDMGGIRLTVDFPLVSMFSRQKNPVFDGILRHGRERFSNSRLVSRQDGIREIVRGLRGGIPLYYLPDQDFGPRDALFVPFFGVPAATITALGRIAKIAGAVVVPCVTRQLPGSGGYVARFYPAWPDFPSGDDAVDTRRMNAFIEERVEEMPEQYFWMHKRFKTRPAGETRFY